MNGFFKYNTPTYMNESIETGIICASGWKLTDFHLGSGVQKSMTTHWFLRLVKFIYFKFQKALWSLDRHRYFDTDKFCGNLIQTTVLYCWKMLVSTEINVHRLFFIVMEGNGHVKILF